MRMEEAFYNIYMYLYNKNVLEYAQIARSGPKSMIRNIEGSSNMHSIMVCCKNMSSTSYYPYLKLTPKLFIVVTLLQ